MPKQLPYFEYQLAALANWLPPGTLLLAAGMDKHLSPHTATLMEHYFGPTTRHRGQRKARVFSAQRAERPAPEFDCWTGYDCPEAGGKLRSLPNVFSRDGLDIGSRFLLEHLHMLAPVQRAADLACGNGVLGIAALRQGLSQHMHFCDESAMAVASARDNAARLAAQPGACEFHHGDGLGSVSRDLELILCNPPFHLGHTVDDYAGRRLLAGCADYLAPGGNLCLVANRHLDYRGTLRRHFSEVEQLAVNRKFIVWSARRG